MKKRLEDSKHVVDLLFVMGIFLFFTLSALMLILIGTRIYKNTVDKMDRNFDTRTSFAYLTEKLRQGDRADSIIISEFGDGNALIMKEDIEGNEYATYIYYSEGHIKELFTSAANNLGPDAGQDILEASSFEVENAGSGLYKLTVVPKKEESTYTFFVGTQSDPGTK